MSDYLRLVPRLETVAQMESLVDELEGLAEMLGANSSVMATLAALRREIESIGEEDEQA